MYHKCRQLLCAFSVAALVLSLTGLVLAQSSARGAISGSVKDPSGAAVAGATVAIKNEQTSVTERTVTTSGDGAFSATLLPIGKYTVTVTASGFNKAEATGIKVNVTETTAVTIALKVGAVTEALTISDASTAVQSSNATTGQSLGSDTVSSLPLATRNFLTLLSYAPN